MRGLVLGTLAFGLSRAILRAANSRIKQRWSRKTSFRVPHREGTSLSSIVAECESRWFLEDLQLAMAGDDEAMVRVGHMLMSGYGVQLDDQKAAAWLKQAMAIQNYRDPGSGICAVDFDDSAVPALHSRSTSKADSSSALGTASTGLHFVSMMKVAPSWRLASLISLQRLTARAQRGVAGQRSVPLVPPQCVSCSSPAAHSHDECREDHADIAQVGSSCIDDSEEWSCSSGQLSWSCSLQDVHAKTLQVGVSATAPSLWVQPEPLLLQGPRRSALSEGGLPNSLEAGCAKRFAVLC